MTRITANTKRNSTQDDTANVPAYVKDARAKLNKGADTQEVISEVVNQFVMGMAQRKFGTQLETAQFVAKSLENLSTLAKSGEYDKLIDKSKFQDLWSWYETAHDSIGTFYMKVLAPDALDYHGFIDACSCATTHTTISPICPACKTTSLEICTDFIIDRPTKKLVSVVCECSHCGLSPTLDIELVKPQSEETSLTRSYIRSLLVFEEYKPNCDSIVDKQIRERVVHQASNALMHLPNGLIYDYDKTVREEMARFGR